MGKTRKVSKGQSSHFVPDYRHAVETMNELERVGSMGRGDTEMTGSEGSCAPKRRCVDGSGVPVRVFPVSEMLDSERLELEYRFRNELQHVRMLQRRLDAVGSNALMSPSGDMHSSDDRFTRILQRRMGSMGADALPSSASDVRSLGGGIKRPGLEDSNRDINEVNMLKGKKKPPQGRNWQRSKVSGARQPEPALPSNTTVSMLMKQCETLLQRLMSQNVAYIFNEPVDIVKSNIPDYFTIIKQPMDLGTIKSKLLSGQYSDPLGFAADVRLTFSNAMTYNPPGNGVHDMAKTLSKFFEVRWKPIEKKFSMMADFLLPSKPSSNIESETATSKPPVKKKKVSNVEHEVKQKISMRVMTLDEKQRLTAELEEVASELPDSIIDFLKGNTNNSSDSNEGELEIDLDSLTDETLFTLRELLNNYLSTKQKSEGKVEPCEIELHNESMFSNSSVQPGRGNYLADEDVDIGANDAPISSFPPLEIENDGAGRNIKYGSSSSSSDSGSSSSDSDTGSASHGDSVGIKNQTQVNEKDTCITGGSLEQKGSCIGATATGAGDILNGDVQPNSNRTVDSGSSNGGQEGGGNAPIERQVSPGKNYRAAFLKGRFADTILKAQEKTLEKAEKMDLDRLRLEREEFERKKKEGKARLLAEARAAEVAHRKVEAEAAAAAKRKRELEREAARQALQKMEKTVHINENTQFLEDLDILRSAPEQSSLGLTSPDDDQNGLGSFNLQDSSNPLEQLGLYMKDDDDEEEEGDHHIISQMEKTVNINENMQSVEGLELLRSTPEQSLLGVTSPDGDQNGLGSLNLQDSSNPLEQLGLYMKDDDEEEEGDNHITSQMEKTVNINENTQSVEGLELLRSTPEHSLLGVTSPGDNQNGIGSCNLQASFNSLEQLGLNKKDADEEEEGELHISSQMETTVNINENTQSMEDLEILESSAPAQSLLGGTCPGDDQNDKLQANDNPFKQLGPYKEEEEEEESEHHISSLMDTTDNINENTQSMEDLKIPGSAPEQSLFEVTSPDNDQNGLGSYDLQARSNPLEQLGLYKKDGDEEDGEHLISQMETTISINENTQSLEDLEIHKSSPEQSLLEMTNPDDDQTGIGSDNLQTSSNPLEQLRLPNKDGDEEEEGEHHISSQVETAISINENTQSLEDHEIIRSAPEQSLLETRPDDDQTGLGSYNLLASTNPLEQLGLYKKGHDEEEDGEHHMSSQVETTNNINENTRSLEDQEILRSSPEQSLLGSRPDDDQTDLGSYNLQASTNPLEQLGLHKKDEKEEEGEPHISSQIETTNNINENTQSPDQKILRSAPEQSLSGVTSPDDDQTGLGSYNLQASSNPLEQLGLRKKDKEEEGEPNISSQKETTININENSQTLQDLEIHRSTLERSLLEVTSPNDSQAGIGRCSLQASSNPLEQLGQYMKDDDEEEGEA